VVVQSRLGPTEELYLTPVGLGVVVVVGGGGGGGGVVA
jgi:hypothetical protein